ncbi:hypothetical protein HGA64_00005, partial [Candidatus Falkowbacteria bacterium]|nr:hypothetical protein [Candidatus Falkowbacteria bacterium]
MSEKSWQFYHDSESAWEAMLADCRLATKTIDFEQFILLNDVVGKKFFDVFEQKAKEGVKVRLICDAAGSYSFYNSALPGRLAKLGVKIKFFNPIKPWRLHNITSWF